MRRTRGVAARRIRRAHRIAYDLGISPGDPKYYRMRAAEYRAAVKNTKGWERKFMRGLARFFEALGRGG